MGFPLMVPARSGWAIEAIDRRLEDAARRSGRVAYWVFLTVTLPLALPGLIAGLVLCFAKAWASSARHHRFVANIPGETQTISAAIYTFTRCPTRRGGGALVAGGHRHLARGAGCAEWLSRRAGMRFHGE